MKIFLLERFTRCVSRCALFFVSTIFLVSITLLVISLFVRHPNECLRNPIEGLDVESSILGAKLRSYREFGESTTWQPKFTKVTTAFNAENGGQQGGNLLSPLSTDSADFSSLTTEATRRIVGARKTKKPPDSSPPRPSVLPFAMPLTSSKQQQRLLDVAACSGWAEGGLIAKNSLPLPFKSSANDDLLSPQSIWALCQLAERIEQNPQYMAVCRRKPITIDEAFDHGGHLYKPGCCPVISIHTFMQMVFPHQDPCQQASKVTLSQTENLRSDIFFCKRTANDPHFANETYPFCVDFRQQISAFLTFLADKNFLKETQMLTLSNIWLPLKEESETEHDHQQQLTEVHDLEVVERLVEELKEQNASSKFQILFQLPKNQNVANAQRRRRMYDFANEFLRSIESMALVGVASLVPLFFLIAMANFSVLRILGMFFAYFCVFSCSYFSVFVAYGNQPTFIGLLLPLVYSAILLFDAFFNFSASMTSASSATRSDGRSFQQTLQSGMRTSFWPFTHMTLIQTALTFSVIGIAIGDITVVQQICLFLAVLSGFIYGFLLLWLPASCALSFRNKQNVSLPVISDLDSNPDTKICCMSYELRARTAIKRVTFAFAPVFNKIVNALTFAFYRFGIIFCCLPLVIVAGSLALMFYCGISFEQKNGDSNLVSLFSIPLPVIVVNPASFLGGPTKLHTSFAYEDQKQAYRSLLKGTNRSDIDPFFDCTNAFQRISFVFRVDQEKMESGSDNVLFTPETQLWFRRFCNESRHWLQTGGGGGEVGRHRVSVHPLRECAVERLEPFLKNRPCQVMRDVDGRDMMLDASPCCETYRFPWEPAVYKQCIRQYVIDRILTTGREPNIDLRFSKDGTTEVGFFVEYDVTFLNYRSKDTNGTGTNILENNSCDLMLNLYDKTVAWFENQLRSAPIQLQSSSNAFVASPQLTGQNLRMTTSKTLVYGLLVGVGLVAVSALLATLNLVNAAFTLISILCGILMTGSLIFALKWQIGIYEDVLLAVFLLPLVAKGPLFTAMTFRRYFYHFQISGGLIKPTDFNIESIIRATLYHSLGVLAQSFVFTVLLTLPLVFETNFVFVARLSQFLAIGSSSSFFIAIFCLVPLLSKFARTAQHFGLSATVFDAPLLAKHDSGSKHCNKRNSPPSSTSPKSGSTSSGTVSSSSHHSNEGVDEAIIVAVPSSVSPDQQSVPQIRKLSLPNHTGSCRINRKLLQQAEVRRIDNSELYGTEIKPRSELPPSVSSHELIWVPRYPAAGVSLEEFRIVYSPPGGESPQPLARGPGSNHHMAMSWSAASTSYNAVACLEDLEQEFRQIVRPPPPVASHLQSTTGSVATVISHSKSFQSGATLTNNNSSDNSGSNNLLFSPSYHTISDVIKNSAGRNNCISHDV